MGVDHRLPPVELLPDGREGGVPQVLVLVARHETDALRLERIQGVADFLQRSLGIEKRQRREAREAALVVARKLRAEFVREARDLAAFFAPCAISPPGSRVAAPSATSVPRKPRRGAQQAQFGSSGFSALLFFEAMLMDLLL